MKVALSYVLMALLSTLFLIEEPKEIEKEVYIPFLSCEIDYEDINKLEAWKEWKSYLRESVGRELHTWDTMIMETAGGITITGNYTVYGEKDFVLTYAVRVSRRVGEKHYEFELKDYKELK